MTTEAERDFSTSFCDTPSFAKRSSSLYNLIKYNLKLSKVEDNVDSAAAQEPIAEPKVLEPALPGCVQGAEPSESAEPPCAGPKASDNYLERPVT